MSLQLPSTFGPNTPVWFSFKEFSKRLDDSLPVYLEAIITNTDPKDSLRYLIRFPTLTRSINQSSSDSITSEIARLPSPVADTFSVPSTLLELRSDNIDHKQYIAMNDLVQLPNLNEPELLKAIGHRYMADKIFSYVGPTLLVVNPYKKIANLFSDQVQQYFEQLVLQQSDISSSPPHIFAIAAQSIQSIMSGRSDKQAIVISGESGAGKTENTKYAMNFLTHINAIIDSSRRNSLQQQSLLSFPTSETFIPLHQHSHPPQQQSTTSLSDISIEKRILNCNPILEAFGNAKTTRNDNSSRFGKLVIFHFGQPSLSNSENNSPPPSSSKRKIHPPTPGSSTIRSRRQSKQSIDDAPMTIQSATLTNYLLEKSRIVRIQPQERNYHIFYFLLAGASKSFLDSLGLQSNNPIYYKYLRSECPSVEKLADSDLFEEVQTSLNDLCFSDTEQQSIWSIVSTVLLLGNLEFSSSLESSETIGLSQSIESKRITEQIVNKLKCTETSLTQALTTKRIEVNKQITMSPLKMQEVLENRDSLSKYLYDSLFQFIVRRLNESIAPASAIHSCSASIEILDIFGFEVFIENSFEQLCINFANEKLQQLYIRYIYEGEKQLFRLQNLTEYLTEIIYTDNKAIIDALERMREPPIGVFPLIDESSSIMQGTDTALIASIKKQHQSNQPSACITFPQRNPLRFAVNHSAGAVEYTIIDFRAKNKDEVSLMLQNLTQDVHLKHILHNQVDASTTSQQPQQKSLGSKFRTQMKSLMDELQSCECQFVRCIKPNALKQPNLVETRYSLNQINCLGVLETIRVRKQGYSYRAPYARFYYDHWQLSPPAKIFPNSIGVVESFTKETIIQLVKKLIVRWVPIPDIEMNNLLLGESLVLMRQSVVNHLLAKQQKIKDEILKKSCIIQRYYRAWQIRKALKHIRRIKSMLTMLVFRFRFLRSDQMKKLKEQRKARENEARYQEYIKRIQRCFRRYLLRKKQAIQAAAMKILLAYQAYKYRQAQKLRLENTNAFIKSKFQMLKQRRIYLNLLNKVIFIQAYFRGNKARKQVSVLRMLQTAFELAWDRIRNQSATIINASMRMFLAKAQHADIVAASREAGNRIRRQKAVLRIQRYRRYLQFHRALQVYRNAASRIQAYFRMRWCSFVYQLILKNVRLIQRHSRTWLQEKCYLSEKWAHQFDWNSVKRDVLYSQQNLLSLGIPFNKAPQQQTIMSSATISNPAMMQLKKQYESIFENQMRIKAAATKIPVTTLGRSLSNFSSVSSVIQKPRSNELSSSMNSTTQFYFNQLGINRDSESQLKLKENERQRERVGTVMRLDADQVPLKTLIVDLDQLPSSHEIYSNHRWAHTYNHIDSILSAQRASVLRILISEVSTTIISDNSTVSTFGSIFDESWGSQSNTSQQQQRNVNSFCIQNLDGAFIGNSGQIFVKQVDPSKQQASLYCWGDNSAGDLMVLDNSDPFISAPQLLKTDFATFTASIDQEKQTKNYQFLQIDGDVLSSHAKDYHALIRVQLPSTIIQVSCGGSFSLFLTSLGQVYSSGKNTSGELGLGDRRSRERPEELVYFRKLGEKMSSIACGLKHSLCVSSLGKVFAWGSNRFGQLGVGDTKNRFKPERVQIKSSESTLAAAAIGTGISWTVKATMRASICAALGYNETKTIMWWGTNATLQMQVTPVLLNLATYLPDPSKAKEFIPLQVLTSWSQNLSVTYIIGADLQRTAPNKRHSLLKHLAVLSKAWHCDKVFPPLQKNLDKIAQISQVKEKQVHQQSQPQKARPPQNTLACSMTLFNRSMQQSTR